MAARRIGDDERRSRLPEFCFPVAVHDVWAGIRCAAPFKESVSPSADRVGQRGISEGKLVTGIDMVFVLLLPAAWLTKLIIRKGFPGPCDIWMDPIEDYSSGDILVESLIDKIPEGSTTLRAPERDDCLG